MKCKMKENQKTKFSLPFSAVLTYLLLIAVALSGVTFSKYVTGTTVGDSARVAYMRDIAISETGNFTAPDKWIIAPGVDMIKNAAVEFEGSEMACYVFLEIKANGWNRIDTYGYAYTAAGGENLLAWSVNNDWVYLSGSENGAVYYHIVSANSVLDAEVIADGGIVTVSENLTKTQLDGLPADMSIKIGATAVQYHGFSEGFGAGYTETKRAAAAWNALRDK